jgi:hypothetical protein
MPPTTSSNRGLRREAFFPFARVARCKPKIPIWVCFGGPWSRKSCWCIFRPPGTGYDHLCRILYSHSDILYDPLVYFVVIWYILVFCTKKSLATLLRAHFLSLFVGGSRSLRLSAFLDSGPLSGQSRNRLGQKCLRSPQGDQIRLWKKLPKM